MATLRQKRAAKLVLNGATPTQAMTEAGYAPSSIHKPGEALLSTQGYKEALAEYGLTEELIASSLVKDIKAKPKRRSRELELGADILNMRKRDAGSNNKTLIVVISGQSASRYGAVPHPSTGNDSA